MLTYIDSVIPIYLFDNSTTLRSRAMRRLANLRARGSLLAISDLVRLECRIGPMRSGDAKKLALFDASFATPRIQVVPITRVVFDRATQIRAQHRFQTADSIHLATAVESGCDGFLTHDTRLAGFPDITVEILP